MTRILITGGAGFIGSNLALALLADGHEITVIDTLSPQIHGPELDASPLYASIRDKVRFIHGSVADEALMAEAMKNQDVIVHYAAETGTGQSMYQVAHYTDVNVSATAQMLDLLGRGDYDVHRIVVASSRSIYGEGKYSDASGQVLYPPHRANDDLEAGQFEVLDPGTKVPLTMLPTNEEARIHPSSVYGITKQVQEQLIMTVCPLLGIAPVALRYQNVYGPGQSLSNPYTGILSIFSNLIMQGKGINIFEDGLESRDFVYIDDVVTATMLAIFEDNAMGEVFNVGSGVATTVNQVTDTLLVKFSAEVTVQISGNFRLGDIRHNVADLCKARDRLGFEPKVGFDAGIERFVAWAAELGPTASAYERSLAEMRKRGLFKGANT